MKWHGQQWGEQLVREAQQIREQVDRDRQQIRERAQQGRKEEAEQYLEGRTADLLGKAHARAQYQVYQACMFPLPMTRSSHPGGRPRSNSPPPLDDAWIRRAEAKLQIGDHNNFIRTSVRRMLRDTCGLSQRTAQNLGDSAEYAVDAAVAYFLGGLSKVSKAAGFAEQVIKSAS
jgi:hypothetical protein